MLDRKLRQNVPFSTTGGVIIVYFFHPRYSFPHTCIFTIQVR